MKEWTTRKSRLAGADPLAENRLYNLLANMLYVGKVYSGGQFYEDKYEAIVGADVGPPV